MSWRVGTVTAVRRETPNARTLVIDVPGWPGNLAGQHLDLRLTAEDGYQAARSYSIASVGASPIELTVDELPDGEVSPYLVEDLAVGDELELRGPVGRWFVWLPDGLESPRPVQLIGGGSGAVPLMAMARAHRAARSAASMRLLLSVRGPEFVFYRDELVAQQVDDDAFALDLVYTRTAPEGWPDAVGRLTRDRLANLALPAAARPLVFVCGPTAFVESVADWLVELGHAPADVRTERFGG